MRVLLSVLLAAACAGALCAQPGDLPPLNEPGTNQSLQGKIVWADLHTADPDAALKFYTGLFGWSSREIQRAKHPYYVLSADGQPVAGVALRPATAQDQDRGRWIIYLAVADVPRTLAVAVANGGHVLFPAKDLPRRGTQALLADDQGALFGALHSSSGDPEDYEPALGQWAWAHVFEKDSAAAARFYAAVLGYEAQPDPTKDRNDVFILASQGMARAGLGPLPQNSQADPGWLGFVRVANLDETVSRASALGGQVLVAPKSTHPGSRLAILADPVGAVIGVMEMSDPAALQKLAQPQAKAQP